MKVFLEKISGVLAIIVMVVAVLTLLGWQFDIAIFRQPIPGLAAMNPMTAVGFLLCGISLQLTAGKSIRIISVFILFTIGLLRLLAVTVNVDTGIDRLLYSDRLLTHATGIVFQRMAPNTAFNFVLISIALLFLHTESARKLVIKQYIALIISGVALLSILGYAYYVHEFYDIMSQFPMAIHTAFCFVFLAVAILFKNPEKGLMKEVTGPYVGSVTIRRLLPVAILGPFLLGFFRLAGSWEGAISLELGTAIFVLSIIFIFLAVLWYNGKLLNKQDYLNSVSQRSLKENEEQISTIFNAAPDGVVVIDEGGRIIKWNPRAETMFGWKEKEVLGKLLTETIIPQRYRDAHTKGLKKYLLTGQGPVLDKTIEVQAVDRKQVEFDVALSISPTLLNEKYIFIGFIRDITDQRKLEKKFRSLLESAPDAMVIVNSKGIIELVNAQTEKLFGYKRDEINGKKVEILMPSRHNVSHSSHRANFFINPKLRAMGEGRELYGMKKDGTEFPVEISLSPLETEEGLLVSAAIRDISEKKNMEMQVREANVNLEKKVKQRTAELEEKNKELEQFAYVSSHDLQEPLRTTSGFVEIFRKKYHGKLDPEADRILDYLVEANDRMKVLIKELLEYSRIGRKRKLEPVDCSEIVRNVLVDLGQAIRDVDAAIMVNELPVIDGYPVELKLLFQNLISNAIKFRKKDEPPVVIISAEKKGDYWQFTVKDNGIGIDPKFADRIFVIFQRLHTRTEYEGTGIGLAHCKKIVELHSGRIWVESQLNKGSTFHFTLFEN